MSIEQSFDDKSEALITPEVFYGAHEKIADICIVTFSHAVLEKVLKRFSCKKIANSFTANGKIPVYLLEEYGILFYMSPVGSAAAGTILDEEKCKSKIIVPSEAYRDEGFSYHFERADNYIKVPKSKDLAEILSALQVNYVVGKTWTTDAIYRETSNNKNARKNEGCICVEMECSGLQAVCNYRHLDLYQFFFGGDLLSDSGWSRGTLGTDVEKSNQIDCFELALKIAERIK